jgi:hypothetical protein
MMLAEILRKLCSMEESAGTMATLTLEIGQGRPSPEARQFLKNTVRKRLDSGGDSVGAREVWTSIAERIAEHVETELHPETQGLFVTAGRKAWRSIELPVSMRNFVHIGRRPYVAPLQEAATRAPRAYILKYDQDEGVLEDLELGTWKEVERIRSAAVERDAEHKTSARASLGRTGSRRAGGGMGGGGRDRFERHFEDAAEAMLRQAAARVVSLQKAAPSEAIYAFGDREHFPFFRDHLPAGLRAQALHVGPMPRRHEELLKKAVKREIDHLSAERVNRAIAEFHARRAEGYRVALGPAEVLPLLDTGKVSRVFMDAYDPLMGGKCPECGALYEGVRERCDPCGKALVVGSMTQEVVAHAVLHPPLPITFVPSSQRWLKELGGMAALLSKKGVRSRR